MPGAFVRVAMGKLIEMYGYYALAIRSQRWRSFSRRFRA